MILDYRKGKKACYFLLPLPTSLNKLYAPNKNGGLRKTAFALAWQHEVQLRLNQFDTKPYKCPVYVEIVLSLHRGDIDNFFKLMFDTLQGYAYGNDSQIARLNVYRQFVTDDEKNVQLKIMPFNGVYPRIWELD